jgi:hypothetical protein
MGTEEPLRGEFGGREGDEMAPTTRVVFVGGEAGEIPRHWFCSPLALDQKILPFRAHHEIFPPTGFHLNTTLPTTEPLVPLPRMP